jgi:hypothetical protein
MRLDRRRSDTECSSLVLGAVGLTFGDTRPFFELPRRDNLSCHFEMIGIALDVC